MFKAEEVTFTADILSPRKNANKYDKIVERIFLHVYLVWK
jgi:hypothetical protein